MRILTKARAAGFGAALCSLLLFAARNDKSAPSVSILSPVSGSVVDGLVDVRLQTTDNVTATRIAVVVDGVAVCNQSNLGTPKTKTWTCPWESALETEQLRTITATAWDAAGNHRSVSMQVTSAARFYIVTESLPGATCGQPYRAEIRATGGIRPYSWSMVGGALPDGLTLQVEGDSFVLSGTPPADASGGCPAATRIEQLSQSLLAQSHSQSVMKGWK